MTALLNDVTTTFGRFPRERSGGNVVPLAGLLGIAQICSSWVRCSHRP